MAGAPPIVEERTEAVIISGPRKGEIIALSNNEVQLTPEESALLDQIVDRSRRMAASATAAASELDAILEDLRA